MTEIQFADLIQQVRIVQGYKLFDHEELAIAKRGWRQALSSIPPGDWVLAFEEAIKSYDGGFFDGPFVNRIYRNFGRRPNPENLVELEKLARLTLRDPDSPVKMNILRPIAEWAEARNEPRRLWEREVIDAVKGYDRTDHSRGVAADDADSADEVPERQDERLCEQAGGYALPGA